MRTPVGGIFKSPSSHCLPPPGKGLPAQEAGWGRRLCSRFWWPCPAQLGGQRGRGCVGGRRHLRLIQWLVLFAVVHPGQHCPPQTFLLWGHRNRVSIRLLCQIIPRALLMVPPTTGRAWGNSARPGSVLLLGEGCMALAGMGVHFGILHI